MSVVKDNPFKPRKGKEKTSNMKAFDGTFSHYLNRFPDKNNSHFY